MKMAENECCLRPMKCELNILSVPDGSCMFMQGGTAVIAGVYGPVEGKSQKMLYDKASVEANFSSVKGPQSVNDRLMESYIRDSCEATIITALHPGVAVSINVQEMQDCGGLLAAAINASCLALLNAGLPMKFTIAAVKCMIDKNTEQLILDPDDVNLQSARASFTFTFDSIKKDVISCHTTGSFSEKELSICREKCKLASQYVFDFYREIVRKYASII